MKARDSLRKDFIKCEIESLIKKKKKLYLYILSMLIIYIRSKRQKNERHFYLILEIATMTETVSVKLNRLMHNPALYTYTASSEYPLLALKPGCLSASLKIDWKYFTITHVKTGNRIQLQPNVGLSYRQTRALSRILDGEFSVLLYILFRGLIHNLSIRVDIEHPVVAEAAAVELSCISAPKYRADWSLRNLPSSEFV